MEICDFLRNSMISYSEGNPCFHNKIVDFFGKSVISWPSHDKGLPYKPFLSQPYTYTLGGGADWKTCKVGWSYTYGGGGGHRPSVRNLTEFPKSTATIHTVPAV